jgi:2-polyprenyl-6-methoxyphenol hydroxylase-like FAD-dependent oxidoreductase
MARTVLVCGVGIAGPTLAYWMTRQGWRVTLVERAPAFRRGGYIVDFWGPGYEVAARMGILPRLEQRGYAVEEVRLVDADGECVGGFDVDVIRRAQDGRFFSIARGDLAAEIFASVRTDAELLFDDNIRRLAADGTGVDVEFDRSGTRRFDIVVGADGLHSQVRALAFADAQHAERYLGYCVAAFYAKRYRPRDADVYVCYCCPGRSVARFALRDGRTVFFLIFAAPRQPAFAPGSASAQKAGLRRIYAGAGWEWPSIASALDASDDLYFDTVTQVRLSSWHRGRVVLIGDAAFCPSLLAGEGASLAMAAGYVLAGELAHAGADPAPAFERYERSLAGLIADKQRAAAKFGKWFAPRTRLGLALRNGASRLLGVPVVGEIAARRMLSDALQLPNYP